VASGAATREAYFYKGSSAFALNDLTNAASDLEKAIALGWNDAEVFRKLADIRFQTNDFPSAVKAYDKAVGGGLEDAVLYNNRGKAKYNSNDVPGASVDYSKAWQIRPEYDRD